MSASLEAWRLGPHVAKTGSKERQWKRKERLTHHTIYICIYDICRKQGFKQEEGRGTNTILFVPVFV